MNADKSFPRRFDDKQQELTWVNIKGDNIHYRAIE